LSILGNSRAIFIQYFPQTSLYNKKLSKNNSIAERLKGMEKSGSNPFLYKFTALYQNHGKTGN
jgi:hypothetical protein